MNQNNQIENWNLKYFSPSGEKYSGILIIKDSSIEFLQNPTNSKPNLIFSINQDEISSVREKKSIFMRTIYISSNGKNHKFTGSNYNTSGIINKLKNNLNY